MRGEKYIKRILGLVMAAVVFMGITHILNDLYKSDSDRKYRLLWNDYYENRGKIGNLFLGSSHVYCDIDTRVMTELTGEYCFDMATASQRQNGSYFLLREAARDNPITHVYIEMYYFCNSVDLAGRDPIDTQYSRNWQNTDYMKLSANKVAYMLSIADLDKYTDILFPFCRYRAKLGDWDYIRQAMADRNTEAYLAGKYDGTEEYRGQGFWASTKKLEDDSKHYRQDYVLGEQKMGDKSRAYLDKTIRYCQKREIPVTLFVSPMHDLQLVSTVNYDSYISEIRKIAEEYNIPFYDFNLAKEQYLPIRQNRYFRDLQHLNTAGAELFTPFFWRVVSQETSENEAYFYGSYKERLHESAPTVYGIYWREYDTETGEAYKNMWVASNRDEGMQYRIILTPQEGEQYMLQDFEENKGFTVSADESGICTVVMRMAEKPDEMQTMEINY